MKSTDNSKNINYPKIWYFKKYSILLWIFLPLQLLYKFYLVFLKCFTKKKELGVPVVCVGNITLGGSGKTPFVRELFFAAKKMGYNPHILTGSYKQGRKSRIVDSKNMTVQYLDEAVIHSEYATTWQGKDRYISGYLACNYRDKKGSVMPADFLILDDGLQNFKLHYDVNICMIPREENFANCCLFPLGPLREKLSMLLNFDFLVFKQKEWQISKLDKSLKKIDENKVCVLLYDFKLVNYKRKVIDFKKSYIVFSGLADNANFFQSLNKLSLKHNFQILQKVGFKDHYNYSKDEILHLVNQARERGASILTSYKDMVRLRLLASEDTSFEKIIKNIDCLEIETKLSKKSFAQTALKLAQARCNIRQSTTNDDAQKKV